VKALSAEGRVSAYVLLALPFVITMFILAFSPDFLAPLADRVIGRVAIGLGVSLMIIGTIWIRRLVRIDF
jgi:tight adherence protein B